MELKEVLNTGIKYVEITGKGENISDTTKRIYFSKSGAEVIKDKENINDETLNKLELYHSQKGNAVLTKKKDESIITFNGYIQSSYRGTSWIEEIKNGDVESATGCGRIGEHTEFIATLKENGYLIVGFDGRYEKGYRIFQNRNGKLVSNTFSNEEKYCDMFDLDEAKTLAGINEICDITKTDEVQKNLNLLKEKFDEVHTIDECGAVIYKAKVGNLILTISKVEVKNEN